MKQNLGGLGNVKVFQTGWNSDLPFGPALKAMLEEPYTLFAAFIGSTMLTMATHGTDQDMVQRMLTAPNYRKSQLSLILSGVMDLPIAWAFLTVGILLSVFYSVVPSPDFQPQITKSSATISCMRCRRVSRTLIEVFLNHDGLDLGGAERARHEFHKGFLPSLLQPQRNRPAGYPCRADRHIRVWYSHDPRRHDSRQRGFAGRETDDYTIAIGILVTPTEHCSPSFFSGCSRAVVAATERTSSR